MPQEAAATARGKAAARRLEKLTRRIRGVRPLKEAEPKATGEERRRRRRKVPIREEEEKEDLKVLKRATGGGLSLGKPGAGGASPEKKKRGKGGFLELVFLEDKCGVCVCSTC